MLLYTCFNQHCITSSGHPNKPGMPHHPPASTLHQDEGARELVTTLLNRGHPVELHGVNSWCPAHYPAPLDPPRPGRGHVARLSRINTVLALLKGT